MIKFKKEVAKAQIALKNLEGKSFYKGDDVKHSNKYTLSPEIVAILKSFLNQYL